MEQIIKKYPLIFTALILAVIATSVLIGQLIGQQDPTGCETMETEKEIVVEQKIIEVPARSNSDEFSLVLYNDPNPWYIINDKQFTWMGKDAVIIHTCTSQPMINSVDRSTAICLGMNRLILEMDGTKTQIDQFITKSKDDLKMLNDVSLMFGDDENKLVSIDPNDNLLISMDNNGCFFGDGLCGDMNGLTYHVSLADRQVRKLSGEELPWFTIFHQMLWNESGTKAVWATACFEGCPYELLYSYDLKSDTYNLLLTNEDVPGNIDLRISEVEWLDDNTIKVRDKTVTVE